MSAVLEQSKQKQNIWMFIGFFILFLGLYIFLDFEGNTNYVVMTNNFGLGIVLLHLFINMIIALLTSLMMGFSIINHQLTKIEPKGSSAIPVLTFIFGIFTFGCTGCVVAFLSAIGIAFTPLVLPHGNLLWKLAALGIVVLGFIWIVYSIQNMKCKIKAT